MESLVHAMLSNACVVGVLAVVVAVAGRACRRPALIHGLWLVVMLKLVTPPLLPVSLPAGLKLAPGAWSSGEIFGEAGDAIAPLAMGQDLENAELDEAWTEPGGPSGEVAGGDALDGHLTEVSAGWPGIPVRGWSFGISMPAGWRWEHLVLSGVLLGAVAWWILAFVRIMRFHRLIREIGPAAEEWQVRTAELARWMGISGIPIVCLVPGRVPPMLWAVVGRPKVLVPSELWQETSAEQRTALLLHELAHLKRRDHWVRWLELVVGGIYWWHPAVWWGRRLLREAEEQCCDAWVVWAMPQGAKTYATALLAAVEFVSGARTAPTASSAASGNGHVSCLKRRLKMIVRARTPKGLSWASRLAVIGAAALLLPLAPSWGQKSEVNRPVSEPERVVDLYEYNSAPAEDQDQSNVRADQSEREPLLALSQDDDKKKPKDDESATEDKSRATAERFEKRIKELIEKVTKDLGPVGEEVRKALEKSIGEVHATLKKEGVTADDLRRSLEKSHEEMRKALEKGGSVNRELRESMEKSRRDLQQEWERTRNEMRSELRARVESRRQQERGRAIENEGNRAKEGAENEGEREELEKARSEVRSLEQQLRQANRRLVDLQRRVMTRRGPGGRRADVPTTQVVPRATPDDQPSPRGASPGVPRGATPPAETVQPRRAVPPAGGGGSAVTGRRPRLEEGEPRGAGDRPANDARLRELENKLERVLKELQELKADKKAPEAKEPGARFGRPVRSRTPVVL